MKEHQNNMSHRHFLGTGLAAATAFTVIPRHVLGGSGFMAPSDQITIGFIGTGKRARQMIGSYAKKARIIAGCDVDSRKLDRFKTLTEEEYAKSGSSAKGFKTYKDYRDLLKNKDIDFNSGTIKLCRTKNRKEQIIPMSMTLKNVLKEYVKYRKGESDDYLFCNVNGIRFSENGLKLAIRKYNKKRGVSKTSVHLFRHTFAKKWILNGGDVFRLQKILGHSSMEMVREYVNMFSDDLSRDFDTFNPLEEFRNKKGEEIKIKPSKTRVRMVM